jgi:hypothetical protein
MGLACMRGTFLRACAGLFLAGAQLMERRSMEDMLSLRACQKLRVCGGLVIVALMVRWRR